jgi:hypothetical protein
LNPQGVCPVPSLNGCRGKLGRAEEHLRLLQAILQGFAGRFIPNQAYRIEPKPKDPGGNFALKVRVLEPFPALAVGLVIGDAIHNMRAMLDHLIEQLTIGYCCSSLDRTEFPIFDDRQNFFAFKKNGLPDMKSRVTGLHKFRGIHPFLQTVIEKMQPYHRTNDVARHPLWFVHYLDIMDKHQVVPLVGLAGNVAGAQLGGPSDMVHIAWMDTGQLRLRFPFEDGAQIPGLIFGPDTSPNVYVNLQLSLNIEFGQGVPGQGRELMPTIGEAFLCCGGILRYFEPFIEG